MKPLFRGGFVVGLALAATLVAGCRRPMESESTVPTEEANTEMKAEASPKPELTPLPPGRHLLTASPPIAVADLDRLLGVGFTPEEVLAEVERRGVSRRPDASERAHILTLPRGEHFLDAMEAPRNLLSSSALELYGRRLSGQPDQEQWRLSQTEITSNYNAAVQVRAQAAALQQRQSSDYQQRRAALAARLEALKQRRVEMRRRGEMIASITIEIERLEREYNAMVAPY